MLSILRIAARAMPRLLGVVLHTRAGRAVLLFPLFGRPAHVAPEAAIADLAALAASDGFAAARASFRTQRTIPAADGVPTTIVWGRRDLVLPPALSRAEPAASGERTPCASGRLRSPALLRRP
ncbi:hypothetical protein NHF46_06390 [Arthrobacter alpinus]|nr:hypothetical protein [Arthrobacter alpinus]